MPHAAARAHLERRCGSSARLVAGGRGRLALGRRNGDYGSVWLSIFSVPSCLASRWLGGQGLSSLLKIAIWAVLSWFSIWILISKGTQKKWCWTFFMLFLQKSLQYWLAQREIWAIISPEMPFSSHRFRYRRDSDRYRSDTLLSLLNQYQPDTLLSLLIRNQPDTLNWGSIPTWYFIELAESISTWYFIELAESIPTWYFTELARTVVLPAAPERAARTMVPSAA